MGYSGVLDSGKKISHSILNPEILENAKRRFGRFFRKKEGKLIMYIDVIKGQELNVYVSESLEDPSNVMFPVFKQALQALAGIVGQAREFERYDQRDGDFCRQERLFRYSSNIIAFSGQRGGGKTSTMLSFSRIMQRIGKERKEWGDYQELQSAWKELQNVLFIVLSPLEPSVLEGQQSILSVVLSRLYAYGERLMQEANQEGCDEGWLEYVQRKLTRDLQNCQSGIRGVKYQRDAAPQDLRDLQDINDGARLRQYFSDLVEDLLQLATHRGQREVYWNRIDRETCYQNTADKEAYLVLQLDDADSQIDHSYQVLEDVRKYLVVPKMVILMSADVSIFRHLVLEKYAEEFPTLGKVEEERQPLWADLRRMGSKYLDKLIPSIQLVTLPLLDQLVVQQGDNLELRYLKSKPVGKNELSQPEYVFPWAKDAGLGLQDFLLTAIYQKTGIIFVSHTAYVNNIVPTTMRGTMHLLYLLSTMEDIPSHPRDGELTPESLKKLVERQLPIAEENVSRFSRYFREDWLNSKVTRLDDLAFLRHLSSSARSVQVQLTVDYLLQRYKESLPDGFEREDVDQLDKSSQILLEEFMGALHLKHRTQEDFNLSFAIHALFTLGNHCAIWQQKRKAIKEREKVIRDKMGAPDDLLVFDYAPERTYLPSTYRVPEAMQSVVADLNEVDVVFSIETEDEYTVYREIESELETERTRGESANVFVNCMMRGSPQYGFEEYNFMNFINVVLCLQKVSQKKGMGNQVPDRAKGEENMGYGTQQYRIYEMQERALNIAANWDVQDHIFKKMRDEFPMQVVDSKGGKIPIGKALEEIYDRIDTQLRELNSGVLKKDLYNLENNSRNRDNIRFNGIGESFRYATCNGAMISDIMRDWMLRLLKLSHNNQEMELIWDVSDEERHEQSDGAQLDSDVNRLESSLTGVSHSTNGSSGTSADSFSEQPTTQENGSSEESSTCNGAPE